FAPTWDVPREGEREEVVHGGSCQPAGARYAAHRGSRRPVLPPGGHPENGLAGPGGQPAQKFSPGTSANPASGARARGGEGFAGRRPDGGYLFSMIAVSVTSTGLYGTGSAAKSRALDARPGVSVVCPYRQGTGGYFAARSESRSPRETERRVPSGTVRTHPH